ncbi:MAG: acyltransferase family protein [Ilumatobacter sp.]
MSSRDRPPARSPGGSGVDHRISQLPYLPGLDGIRAIAVVAVMVYHANSDWLVGGYLGVEVFFVISGYLITLLLIAEHERRGAIDLRSFWVRRFRRLLPALFVMMLLLTIWVALFERDALGKLRGDVLAGALYGSNFYQIWIGAGYSAGNDFAPLRHLWSLAVEEQFYVIWPLVMIAFVRAGSRRIAGVARWLFLAAVVITVIVALLDHPGAQQSPELTPEAYWFIGDRPISKPDALYLSTFTRAGGLLLGAAFAMVWRPAAIMRGPLRTKGPLFDVLAVGGFVVLGIMCWTVSFQPDQGVHWFLFNGGLFVTGLASIAVIAAVTHRGAVTGRLLSLPVLLWIGTRSYGLYLYHWPIYQIIRNIAANKLVFHEFVLAMVATCVITELSYRYIETPIRQGRLGEVLSRRRRSNLTRGQRRAALAGVVVASGLSVFAIGSMATAELQQNDVQQALDAGKDSTCDVLRDLDCDGVLDVDEDGNPIAASDAEADDVAEAAGFELNDDASIDESVADSGGTADTETETSGDAPVPGQTTVPTTDPAPEPSRLIAVGDSVMLGAAEQLRQLSFAVDALESRSWVNGLDFVQQLQAQDRLPDTLLIHLGTNGRIGNNDMERMMTAVADVPRVILLTNDVDRDYTADNNGLIYDVANQFDNVEVLDWQGLASACPGDCFEADGFHLKPDGRAYYAELIRFTLNN